MTGKFQPLEHSLRQEGRVPLDTAVHILGCTDEAELLKIIGEAYEIGEEDEKKYLVSKDPELRCLVISNYLRVHNGATVEKAMKLLGIEHSPTLYKLRDKSINSFPFRISRARLYLES